MECVGALYLGPKIGAKSRRGYAATAQLGGGGRGCGGGRGGRGPSQAQSDAGLKRREREAEAKKAVEKGEARPEQKKLVERLELTSKARRPARPRVAARPAHLPPSLPYTPPLSPAVLSPPPALPPPLPRPPPARGRRRGEPPLAGPTGSPSLPPPPSQAMWSRKQKEGGLSEDLPLGVTWSKRKRRYRSSMRFGGIIFQLNAFDPDKLGHAAAVARAGRLYASASRLAVEMAGTLKRLEASDMTAVFRTVLMEKEEVLMAGTSVRGDPKCDDYRAAHTARSHLSPGLLLTGGGRSTCTGSNATAALRGSMCRRARPRPARPTSSGSAPCTRCCASASPARRRPGARRRRLSLPTASPRRPSLPGR